MRGDEVVKGRVQSEELVAKETEASLYNEPRAVWGYEGPKDGGGRVAELFSRAQLHLRTLIAAHRGHWAAATSSVVPRSASRHFKAP